MNGKTVAGVVIVGGSGGTGIAVYTLKNSSPDSEEAKIVKTTEDGKVIRKRPENMTIDCIKTQMNKELDVENDPK